MPNSSREQTDEDLALIDELELREMLAEAEAQIAAGQTISHQRVKERTAQRKNDVSSSTTTRPNEE